MMPERFPRPCLDDLPGVRPPVDAGLFRCAAGPAQEMLGEAAEHFVRLRSREAVQNADSFAQWLAASPCHRCAWRRIAGAWDVLGVPLA